MTQEEAIIRVMERDGYTEKQIRKCLASVWKRLKNPSKKMITVFRRVGINEANLSVNWFNTINEFNGAYMSLSDYFELFGKNDVPLFFAITHQAPVIEREYYG